MKDRLAELYVIVFLLFAYLVVSLVGSCSSTDPTVNKVLNETKTKQVKILECGKLEIKVCNGPDKKTISEYENLYCKCNNRRSVEEAMKQRMQWEIN